MKIGLLVERGHEVHESSTALTSIRGQLLREGFVVVMDQGHFLGLVTPADVVRSAGRRIVDCLSETPRVNEEEEVADTLRQMERAGVCVLPVFRDDAFVGVVRQQRIAVCLLEQCERMGRQAGRPEGRTDPELAGGGCGGTCETRQEVSLRKFFELGPVGMAIVAPDSAWIEVNDRLCEILGYTRSELRQMPWPQLTHPDDLEVDRARMQQLLDGRIDGYTMEKRFIRRDGRIIHALISVTCTHGPDGMPDRVFAEARDITEQERVVEQAEQRWAELLHVSRLSTLGEMAAELAHEFSQPLSAIMAYGGACLRQAQSPAPDMARLIQNQQRVLEQALRACEVMRRIREFARRHEPERDTVPLGETIRGAIELVRWKMRQRNIALRLKLEHENLVIRANAVRIEQVVVNLLRNAIDALEDAHAPSVTVETRLSETQQAQVMVSDTGPGVPEALLPRLFEPFFTTKPTGLGVGLSISREIVKMHGGTLEAKRNPAGGMTFTMTLPVVPPGAEE